MPPKGGIFFCKRKSPGEIVGGLFLFRSVEDVQLTQILKLQYIGENVVADEHSLGRQGKDPVFVGGKSVLHVGCHFLPVQILKGEAEQAGKIPAVQSFAEAEAEHNILTQPLPGRYGVALLRQGKDIRSLPSP